MDRRELLVSAAALASAAAAPAWAQVDDLRAAAREGFLYGLPLVEMARARQGLIGASPQSGQRGFNVFAHSRAPADARSRDFSALEADVLYSSAFINLDGGQAQISVPATAGRYFLLTVSDMYGNVLDSVEGRETGREGRRLAVMGPAKRVGVSGYSAPMPRLMPLHKVIRAPSQWVWALARTHLERGDEADLAAAHAIQDALAVSVRSSAPAPAPPVSIDAAWSDYFYAVQMLIEENPPPDAELGFFRRLAPLQLGMDAGFERARFADAEIAQIEAGVADGRTLAQQGAGGPGGWSRPGAPGGAYGQDFLTRARVALAETGAPPTAALALWRAAPPDAPGFASAGRYSLTLSPPPAAGFWSLTLYRVTGEGRLFLAANPAGRFSLSPWTTGLVRRPDGALDIEIARDPPESAARANWLPAPDDGLFTLVLRAYAPTPAAASYAPAPVTSLA